MLKHLFNNPKAYPDFTIVCQDKQWHLHRGCLSKIPYFERLFQQPSFKENQTSTLEIKDYSSKVVEQVFNYLYQFSTLPDWCLTKDAYSLADQWLYEDYKNCMIHYATTAMYCRDNADYVNAWYFLSSLVEENSTQDKKETLSRYQRLFIANLWEKDLDILLAPSICRDLIIYGEKRKDPRLLGFLFHCYEEKIISREELEEHFHNITLDKNNINDKLCSIQKLLSPSYLDTLIANYYVKLELLRKL